MIKKGEHTISNTFVSNHSENHRIYLWPSGETWVCKEWVDLEELGEDASQVDEGHEPSGDDDGSSASTNTEGKEKHSKKVVKKKPSSVEVLNPIMKRPSTMITPKTKAQHKHIMDNPKAIMDSDDSIQEPAQKFKCTDRHREYSKKYHQEFTRLKRLGTCEQVAREKASAAAKDHAQALFG